MGSGGGIEFPEKLGSVAEELQVTGFKFCWREASAPWYLHNRAQKIPAAWREPPEWISPCTENPQVGWAW